MSMTVGGAEGSDTGGKLGGLRPWLRLFLGISGGAVAIACTLGLLVVLTTAVAQAQPMQAQPMQAQPAQARSARESDVGAILPRLRAHEGSGGIREEEQDRIGKDPSWQPPSMHQGILPAKGSSEVAADATGFDDAALESHVAGEIDSDLARDIAEPAAAISSK
ncbi:MAG: hypothetical protein H0T52_16870 [Lautropia sp.]|nr:hypothetical protein [Lautropia sp.]